MRGEPKKASYSVEARGLIGISQLGSILNSAQEQS
jgi:hypothetical protein